MKIHASGVLMKKVQGEKNIEMLCVLHKVTKRSHSKFEDLPYVLLVLGKRCCFFLECNEFEKSEIKSCV